MRRSFFLFSWITLSPFLIFAEPASSSLEPVHIGRIFIDRGDVFDLSVSSHNRVPYTWANAIHVVTREKYVRREILFREGDVLDRDVLKESERLLRSRPIFRRASVTITEPVNGLVDVHIRTDDVWTTSIDVGYGTAGGKNFYRAGILEHNFLGTGHRVGAFARQDIDRTIRGGTYEDPHLFGSRWRAFGGYGRDQKGEEWQESVVRSYDSVLTPYSAGFFFHSVNDEDRLFEQGEEAAYFQHKEKNFRYFASYAVNRTMDRAHRLGIAYEDQKDRFSNIRLVQPEPIPVDRRVAGVLATYELFQNHFQKRHGLRTFDREEDINFGWYFSVEAGPELRQLGATNRGTLGRTFVSKSWSVGEKSLLYTATRAGGRMEKGRIENGILEINMEALVPQDFLGGIFSLRGEAELGKNFPAEKQLLLGGESGLRAYSVRQFSGQRKLLFTAENRWNLLYDWLQVVNIGWAVFADAGGVWRERETIRSRDLKRDAGVGLRFAPSKAFSSSLIRTDVAYAFDHNDRSSRWTINIGGELKFGEEDKRKFDQ